METASASADPLAPLMQGVTKYLVALPEDAFNGLMAAVAKARGTADEPQVGSSRGADDDEPDYPKHWTPARGQGGSR